MTDFVTVYVTNDRAVIDEREARADYDSMLDETSTVTIGSLTYDASRVLQEVDPIAYRCGFNDYTDSQDWAEFQVPSNIFDDDEILDYIENS